MDRRTKQTPTESCRGIEYLGGFGGYDVAGLGQRGPAGETGARRVLRPRRFLGAVPRIRACGKKAHQAIRRMRFPPPTSWAL